MGTGCYLEDLIRAMLDMDRRGEIVKGIYAVGRPCWCQSANIGVSMCISPYENVSNEFILASLAVANMSCSSYFDGS